MIDVASGRPVWALGLMSGTSLDGMDAATLLTDGEGITAFGPTASLAYAPGQAAFLRRAMDWAAAHYPQHGRLARRIDLWDIEEIRAAEAVLHEVQIEALTRCLPEFDAVRGPGEPGWRGWVRPPHAAVALIGMHGQTLLHRPEDGYSLQIGDAARLAGNGWRPLPVVWDFRSADMAAGGEGAPLVPFFHHACARWARLGEPVAFLNIGGVANVTWADPARPTPSEAGACLAFDTGPGNALINDWMEARTGRPMDGDGAAAAAGRVQWQRLGSNALRAYLDRAPPKSLDRNDFAVVLQAMEGLSTEDGAATLTALSVEAVVESARHMPAPPARWLICGGGRRNATMMRTLAERLPGVEPVEAIGLDGDMLEAQAFAYLAIRVLRGLPTSAPATTGCREPVSGGRVSYP
ncbi:MAG TPA: anhydro-N-acetylmuramic acid kinase [Paracoccaceae bacterium]|nr:anhydro-N-acetylmuramic acid kinase [Paracoccaceae bacterium]